MSDQPGEQQLLEFLYACPVGLIACDLAGQIGMMNPHAMQHLLPLAGARDATNIFNALEQHAPELRSLVTAFGPATGRICDGHRIFVDLGPRRHSKTPKVLSCTMVKLGPDRLMATLADVSHQVAQEERLRQADTWFATLLDDVHEYATLSVTSDGRVVSANPCFASQTGHPIVQSLGRRLDELLGTNGSGGDLRLDEQFEIAARDGWHLQEGWQKRSNGERFWCQRLVVARSDNDSNELSGFSVVLRDVPRREAVAADMRRLLTCDHLTGASNRRHFSQVLEREHSRWRELRQSLSLIVLDLDHFKLVNDTHGHPVGDALLCQVVAACTALLPPRGVFARLGGEEFGALLPRFDHDQAVALAEAMRKAVAAMTIPIQEGWLTATASFGCATLDEASGSIDALIALADARLYAAKHAGRNRVGHRYACAA